MPKSGSLLSGKRCLVLDDEFLIALDIQQTLELAGADYVAAVASVPEALELLRGEPEFNLAVLDVKLSDPDVNSLGLAALLAETGRGHGHAARFQKHLRFRHPFLPAIGDGRGDIGEDDGVVDPHGPFRPGETFREFLDLRIGRDEFVESGVEPLDAHFEGWNRPIGRDGGERDEEESGEEFHRARFALSATWSASHSTRCRTARG